MDAAREKAPVAAAQAGVDQARAAVQAAQLQVDNATVEAPVERTVTAINVSVGSIASPQMPQPAVMIEQLNPLQFTLSLTENQIGNVIPRKCFDNLHSCCRCRNCQAARDPCCPCRQPAAAYFYRQSAV
ncbi:MAG: hypothetical protein IMW91_06735 [Firmicutes bacterium]|nr:hypothetical protein [Bacillota bacterium]